MIGVITGVARTALTQVARQFGREVVDRIMAGEAIESILTRDQLRELAKKTGRVAFNELMRIGKEEFIKDTDKKQEDLNQRMDNFSRNLNEEFKKNTTLYKEERNIQNKNKIEDRQGLTNAYRSPSGIYRTGNTLYISGTGGKDGDFERDWMELFKPRPSGSSSLLSSVWRIRSSVVVMGFRESVQVVKSVPDL